MIKVFISYEHKDMLYKDELEKRLIPFKRNGIIESWSDQQILPGAEWQREIKDAIENSQLILFLISPDFIASEYIYDQEISRALDRYRKREVMIIPIILRPTDYSSLEISKFQALPKDGHPISTSQDQDSAWLDVINQLGKIFDSLNKGNVKLREKSAVNTSTNFEENDNTNAIDYIRNSIANAKIEEALKALLNISQKSGDSDLYNEILLLTSRYNRLKKSNLRGIISSENLDISMSQISNAMLSLLKDIER